MSVKKVVSNEPEWIIKRKKSYAVKKATDTVSVYVVKTERPEIRFVFNGKCAEVFGERYMVFSDITNPNRIYFKIDDDKGYKTTRYKTHTQVHFQVSEEQREAVKALWVGADYEVHEERGYYYIERVDEIETLFEEAPKPIAQRLELKFVPERKSDRMQLLVRPSSRDALKRIADEKNTSVNDLVNSIVETYIDKKEQKQTMQNAITVNPTPESVINDKKVLALLANMKGKGFVSLVDIKSMNMNDREYFRALNDLVITYGYATVNVPCVNHTGKKYYVTALYNGTGVWE